MVYAKRVIDVHIHHGSEIDALDMCPGNDLFWWKGTHSLVGDLQDEAMTVSDATFTTRGVRHLLNAPFPQIPPLKLEHLVQSMDAANVTHGVLCGIDAELFYGWGKRRKSYVWKVPPEYTRKCVDQYPSRFLGEVGVNPMKGNAYALKELERGVKDFGCVGMKLFTPCGFVADDVELCYPLYEKCIELGVHATIHANGEAILGSRLKGCRPLDVDNVPSDFPELKIHMLHLATWLGDEINGLAVMLHSPKMYTCSSPAGTRVDTPEHFGWGTRPELVHLCEKLIPDRLMFGTDYPCTYPHSRAIENFENMDVGSGFLEKFFCENARRFYNIK